MSTDSMDLIGEICPIPLMKVRQRMEAAAAGEVVAVLTEQVHVARNIIEWAQAAGYRYSLRELADTGWEITLVGKGRRSS